MENKEQKVYTEEDVKELLEEANYVFNLKAKYNKDMNSVAGLGEQELGVSKEKLIRIKDYQHYKGRGWVDGNPLLKDPEVPMRFPDRVSPIFIKLRDLFKDLSEVGMLYLIDEYLDALKAEGITITSTIPVADPKQRGIEIINHLDELQGTICGLANEIRDNYKPKAEEIGFTPKRDFDKVLELYNKKSYGKDITAPADKLLIENLTTNKATEYVKKETNIKEV